MHPDRPDLPFIPPPSFPSASGALARALLDSAVGDSERQAALLSDLLPVYCDKVLSAKERGSPAALACWGALAAAASEEQVTATLLPTVVRMTKRNPEPALAAAAPMLAALRCGRAGGQRAGRAPVLTPSRLVAWLVGLSHLDASLGSFAVDASNALLPTVT